MNKYLIVIGMILMLLAIGLSGCVDTLTTDVLTVDTLLANSLKYKGKVVTVEGYFGEEEFYNVIHWTSYFLYDKSGTYHIELFEASGENLEHLKDNAHIRVTGQFNGGSSIDVESFIKL